MKIYLAKPEPMAEDGHALLRLMQNVNLPVLDLLIREAVQNSLDAYDRNSSFVNVEIKTGSFKSNRLNSYLTKAADRLDKKYPASNEYEFIEIRDSKTTGLTGPKSYGDAIRKGEYGNFVKLVYDISKHQDQDGAGGSWGLGKTVYFRVGIGLVVYYSRIKDNSSYKSRLAVCLVEDQQRTDTILNYGTGLTRGIAWWGELSNNGNSEYPCAIEDEETIDSVLDVFGLKPFRQDETGTSIIIPYVDSAKLLNEAYPTNESEINKPYWAKSLDEYLFVSLQRWYAPRIANPNYKYPPYLKTSVNGKAITENGMLPLFRTVRDLYNYAHGIQVGEDSPILGKEKHNISVTKNGVFRTINTIGNFCYTKLGIRDLRMTAPDNVRCPFQQIDNITVPNDERNGAILMYTRKPGLIINYEIDDRTVTSRKDEYIIGLFVADSNNELRADFDRPDDGKILTVEEYLRGSEKSDHAAWSDRVVNTKSPNLVLKIGKSIQNALKETYADTHRPVEEVERTGLGYTLADMLLPSEGFGSGPDPDITPPQPPRVSRTKRTGITITSAPEYDNGQIKVDYELAVCGGAADVFLIVPAEYKKYDAKDWEEDLGKPFPLSLTAFSVTSYRQAGQRGKAASCDIFLDLDDRTKRNACRSDLNLEVKYCNSSNLGVYSCIRVVKNDKPMVLTGTFSVKSSDLSVKCDFGVKEVKSL